MAMHGIEASSSELSGECFPPNTLGVASVFLLENLNGLPLTARKQSWVFLFHDAERATALQGLQHRVSG